MYSWSEESRMLEPSHDKGVLRYLPAVAHGATSMNAGVSSQYPGQNAVICKSRLAGLSGWGFLEWFVIAQTALPALLYLPGTQAFRVPIRIAPFALSFVALVWLTTQKAAVTFRHPARPFLLGAMAYLSVMVLHPTTNTLLAGIAQAMLYLSVMAPIFWAPSLVRSHEQLVRLLGLLLASNGLNAMVGVLQVYDPERWLPQEFSSIVLNSAYGLDPLTYVGPDGRRVVRPPGLFDNPGAVCGPGMVAAFLGLAFATSGLTAWKKSVALALASTGMIAIYLSQVRTSFLILLGMAALYAFVLLAQGHKLKVLGFLGTACVLGIGALLFASNIGGEAIQARFSTLLDDDPMTVYYAASRGPMLEHAFTNLLSDFPLGAGLARWGMMRTYFGNPWNFDSPEIWSELQYSAWILDGGIVLLLCYGMALLVTAIKEFHLIQTSTPPDLRFWAAAVFGVNMGVLALTFGFTPFTTQTGMQYWFLAGVLYGTTGIVSHHDE
jgi:hypothetical protein